MIEKTKQFTASIDSGIYSKLKTISNNSNFYSVQSVLNEILKTSLHTKEGMCLVVEADDGKRKTLADWIEKGEEEVTLDDFAAYTMNSRSISKQFKESFNTLSIKEKNKLKEFIESILVYIKKKNFTPKIGTNINASIHAFNNNGDEDAYNGSHVLYLKIENYKIYIGGLMHLNRRSLQLRSEKYPENSDFVWQKILKCINLNISDFQEYIEQKAYIVDANSLEILINYFNNLEISRTT